MRECNTTTFTNVVAGAPSQSLELIVETGESVAMDGTKYSAHLAPAVCPPHDLVLVSRKCPTCDGKRTFKVRGWFGREKDAPCARCDGEGRIDLEVPLAQIVGTVPCKPRAFADRNLFYLRELEKEMEKRLKPLEAALARKPKKKKAKKKAKARTKARRK